MSRKANPAVTMSVDAVVPVHGNWPVTRNCLRSLRDQTHLHRVILVDDASPDDTLGRVIEEFPEVDVIALERNVGFAAACNHGMNRSTADVVVLINNDVTASPTMLERLVGAFADPAVGSASPLLLRPDGRIDALGLCADQTLAGFLRLHGAPADAVDGPAPRLLGPYGAVAAYRRTALDEVGLLDEGIHMYGEELDLALRLSGAGWHPASVPDAVGVHLGGATSGRGSSRQRRNAGFGRGYLLRAYGILRGRYGMRAAVTEVIAALGDAAGARDLASLRGRIAGWHAARGAAPRPRMIPDLDPSIGFVASLRLRIASR